MRPSRQWHTHTCRRPVRVERVGGQLFPDDFKGVCSGATQSRAADYARSKMHKAVYFETYEDELLDESTRLPSDWTVEFVANSNAYAAIDVVGCGSGQTRNWPRSAPVMRTRTRTPAEPVNWYTATYELRAYEAGTGKKLGSTTVHADGQDCPTLATFDEGQHAVDMYDSPSDEETTSFLKHVVQP